MDGVGYNLLGKNTHEHIKAICFFVLYHEIWLVLQDHKVSRWTWFREAWFVLSWRLGLNLTVHEVNLDI